MGFSKIQNSSINFSNLENLSPKLGMHMLLGLPISDTLIQGTLIVTEYWQTNQTRQI